MMASSVRPRGTAAIPAAKTVTKMATKMVKMATKMVKMATKMVKMATKMAKIGHLGQAPLDDGSQVLRFPVPCFFAQDGQDGQGCVPPCAKTAMRANA